jgi:hypothetical protein
MMDERYTPRPVETWYPVAAFAALALMAVGCVGLILHLLTDPATLPLDQRALFEAEPKWVFAASGIGFAAGLLGSLLLVLRRTAAERVLLISLMGMGVWLAGMLATPAFPDLLTTNEIAVLVAVLAVSWTIYWFARHSRQRGWLH